MEKASRNVGDRVEIEGGGDDINSHSLAATLPSRADLNSISFGLHELGNPTERYFYIKQNTHWRSPLLTYYFSERYSLFHIIYPSVPTCAAFCPTSKQWIIKQEDNIIVPIPIVRVGLLPKKRCGIESWTDRPGGDFLAAD